MSIWLVYAAYLAAVNPARLRPLLPQQDDRTYWAPVLSGAAAALGVCFVLVAVSTDLLEGLAITPETWRIAAGMIATIMGWRILATPGRPEEPRLRGRWEALVPVAFPLLLTPELIGLVSIFGATEPATRSIGGLVVAVAIAVGSGAIAHRRPTLWLAGARFFAALLILAGLAMVVEGIRDV
jgi:small neutral amino acid transporter SnatA (MarC family)